MYSFVLKKGGGGGNVWQCQVVIFNPFGCSCNRYVSFLIYTLLVVTLQLLDPPVTVYDFQSLLPLPGHRNSGLSKPITSVLLCVSADTEG